MHSDIEGDTGMQDNLRMNVELTELPDLSDGAVGATRRKHRETVALSHLDRLAKELVEMRQAICGAAISTTATVAKPKPKRKQIWSTTSTAAPTSTKAEPLLLWKLREFMKAVDGGLTPSGAEIREALKPLVSNGSNAGASASNTNASANNTDNNIIKLWRQPWGSAPIVAAAVIQSSAETKPMVIVCHSEDQKDKDAQWRGEKIQENGTVLIEGKHAPIPRRCQIERSCADAPVRSTLLQRVKDDTPTPASTTPTEALVFRITVIKEYAESGLYARALAKPESIPALALPLATLRTHPLLKL